MIGGFTSVLVDANPDCQESVRNRLLAKEFTRPESNPIGMAERCGHVDGGRIGEIIMRHLQVMYILAAGGHPNFTKGPADVRLRQHVAIVGPAGLRKSYFSKRFLTEATGGKSIMRHEPTPHAPSYLTVDGGITFERLRGSCTSSGKIIMPLFREADFLYFPELDAYLGGKGPGRDEKIGKLKEILESGLGSAAILKMHEWDDEKAKEFEEKVAGMTGFWYNRALKAFEYQVDAPAIACTTHEDLMKTATTEDAAFITRFDPVRMELTNAEMIHAIRNLPTFRVSWDPLKAINLDIWNSPVRNVPYPPDAMMQRVYDYCLDLFEKAAQEADVSIQSLANSRHVGDMARYMAASAIARVFERRWRDGIPSGKTLGSPIETITYSEADFEFAKQCFGLRVPFLNAEVAEALSKDPDVKKNSGGMTAAKTLLKDYVAHLATAEGVEWPEQIEKFDFVQFCCKGGLAEKTVQNYLSMLRKAGILAGGKWGGNRMSVDNSFLTIRCGLANPHLPKDDGLDDYAAPEPDPDMPSIYEMAGVADDADDEEDEREQYA